MAFIKIKNLKLHPIIGVHEWERKTRQEIILNICIEADLTKAALSDHIQDTLDYQSLTNEIVAMVEQSSFLLIESLGQAVLDIITKHEIVISAEVEVDKPRALRFAESVSVVLSSPQRHRGTSDA